MTDSSDSERIIALEHIRLVGIGYIVAAIFGLISFVENVISYCIHGIFGLGSFTEYAVQNNLKPSLIESTFLFAFASFPLVLAILQAFAYWSIKKRKSIDFCIVVSILSGLYLPVGTIIGLASLSALLRKQTRANFPISQA